MGVVRNTKSLEIVLNEFRKSTEGISVISLVERLGSQLNKSTVYRVLDRLEDDNVLHSFLGSNGLKWYAKSNNCSKESHQDAHPHFQCTECGSVDCLDIHIPIPSIPNRKVQTFKVLIQGVCEQCMKK